MSSGLRAPAAQIDGQQIGYLSPAKLWTSQSPPGWGMPILLNHHAKLGTVPTEVFVEQIGSAAAKFQKSCFFGESSIWKSAHTFWGTCKGRIVSEMCITVSKLHQAVPQWSDCIQTTNVAGYNTWPNQAHVDYSSTHTNHMWQSKISAM